MAGESEGHDGPSTAPTHPPAASGTHISNDPNYDQMVEHINTKRHKLELYQSESHKMRQLFTNSASLRSELGEERNVRPNPLWMNYRTKCVQDITSPEEMRRKLTYFTHSNDVMVVQYSQDNCTACNAVGKVFEMLCHEAAESMPGLKFYGVSRNATPELTKGLVRFPQIKGYSGGQWVDIDFKPPAAFRDELYADVEAEVRRRSHEGRPVTALQTEEMYFSAAGPAMLEITEENLTSFYCKMQARLHNYWKQVSVRRSWFFRKFIKPEMDDAVVDAWRTRSILGEKVVHGPTMPDNFNE